MSWISPPTSLISKYRYTNVGKDNTFNGENPYGSLIIKDDKIYGMTSEGGGSDNGVIFEFDLATDVYNKKTNLMQRRTAPTPNSLVFHQNKLIWSDPKRRIRWPGNYF